MSSITVAYDDLLSRIQNPDDTKEDITKQAKLGTLTVKIVNAVYSVRQQPDNIFSICVNNETILSAHVIKIQQQLNILLNGSSAINDNSAVVNNYATMFATLAQDKLEDIKKLEKLLTDTDKEIEYLKIVLDDTCNAETTDIAISVYDIGIKYRLTLAQKRRYKLRDLIYVNNRHMRLTQEKYIENLKYITEDSPVFYQALYDISYQHVHINDQLNLAIEVKNLSNEMVKLAKKENTAIVFLGRSLIACAAYIEKYHADIEVIKIPASNMSSLYKSMSIISSDNIHNYFNNYFKKISSDKKLLITDYIHSGCSFKATRNLMVKNAYSNKMLFLAVYSPFSSLIRDASIERKQNILESLPYNHILSANRNGSESLDVALLMSAFDGLAPFGKHIIENIKKNIPAAIQAEDGFNLLSELVESI